MKIDVNGIQDELDIDMRNQDILRQRLNKMSLNSPRKDSNEYGDRLSPENV